MATTPTNPAPPDPRNAPIASGKRAVSIAASQVQPPSPLYIQPEDSFALYVTYPLIPSPYTINLLLRWLRPDGEIVTIRRQFVLGASIGTFTFTLGEGWLLSATAVSVLNGVAEPGGIFVTFYVQRDTADASMVMWQLFSDYVSSGHFPSWPYGTNRFSQEGPGRIRSITGTTPGLGAEISETVPNNIRWLLLTFRASLTTSAVVATRKPAFIIDDGVNVLFQSDGSQSAVASNGVTNTLCNTGYLNVGISSASGVAPCPYILLGPGFRIRTSTLSIDVGDQYASPKYLVQEWVSI
jgi:hypothetical protein